MSLFTKFFKESDTQLGVFYPNHYLIAVFRNLETAQQTVKKLRLAGFAEDEVIAAAGQDFIALAKEETGLGSFLMQALSRSSQPSRCLTTATWIWLSTVPRLWQCIARTKRPRRKHGTFFNRSLPWQLGITPMTESSTWLAISILIKRFDVSPADCMSRRRVTDQDTDDRA
jgi:hypothetical protein